MVVTLPAKLEDWNIEILNELIKYKDIESETFDFKGVEINKLYLHICAMANTSGGFIILGVDEVRSEDGEALIGFKKIGFEHGKEDHVGLQMGNNVFNIEPNPSVNIKIITEKDDNKFYTVLKIEHEISKKPFFIKNTGQCYVRIGNSSRPASRSVVLNLCTNFMERWSSVERLRVAVGLLKESLLHLSENIPSAGRESATKLAHVDLTFIRNAALSCEWFLIEHNILGKHVPQGGYETGLNSMLYILETLNAEIDGYNRAGSPDEREKMARVLESWRRGFSSTEHVVEFLDKVIKTADEFLAQYK